MAAWAFPFHDSCACHFGVVHKLMAFGLAIVNSAVVFHTTVEIEILGKFFIWYLDGEHLRSSLK